MSDLVKIGGGSFKQITRGPNQGRVRITGGPHRGKLARFDRWTDQFHNVLVELLVPSNAAAPVLPVAATVGLNAWELAALERALAGYLPRLEQTSGRVLLEKLQRATAGVLTVAA